MGKYNEYGRRVEKIIKEAFADLQKATDAYEKAREDRGRNPKKTGWGVTLEQQIKAQQAELAYRQAEENLRKAKRVYHDKLAKIQEIREELKTAVAEDLLIDPKALDRNTVDILASGLCSPREVVRLYEKAESPTMKRYIANFAKNEAQRIDKDKLMDPVKKAEGRSMLYKISSDTRELTDAEDTDALRSFDVLSFVAERAINNPTMIEKWDELTENALENL